MAYVVSLKQFDGPLDLLLTLITRAQIAITDIFVSEITEQYLESMSAIGEIDMDAASEFLQMAATLIEIKSRALLPTPPKEPEEGEETPEQALIRQLTEYKQFREVSKEMHALEEEAKARMTKLPEEYPLPPPTFELTPMTMEQLSRAFQRVLERFRDREALPEPREREIRRDAFTVQSCMLRIERVLRKGEARFAQLFEGVPEKTEVISVFLALLELLRLGRVRVAQETNYGDIVLTNRDRKE